MDNFELYDARVADNDVRTEFGPAPGLLRNAVTMLAAGPLLVVVPAWLAVSRDRWSWYLALAGLGSVGVAFAVAGVYLLTIWLPRYRLIFGPDGIHLTWQRCSVEVPWNDVRSWWLGVPPDAVRAAAVSGARPRSVLLVEPAEHVTDPAAGPRRIVWSRRRQTWQVCEPDLTDGSEAEIRAALERYAPQRAASTPPSGTASTAGRLGPVTGLRLVGEALLSAVAFGVAVWGFVTLLDEGVEPFKALVVVAAPAVAGVLLAAEVVRVAVAARR